MRYLYSLAAMLFSSFAFAQIDTVNFETQSPWVQTDTTTGNIWQVGKPNKLIFDSAYSAPNAIVTDTLLSYPVNNTSRFTLGFQLYGGQPYIEFKHRFDTDSLKDGGFVEISNDSGNTWTLLSDTTFLGGTSPYFFHWTYGLETYNFYGVDDSLKNAAMGFSGKSNQWITSTIRFPCYAIKKPYELMLRFTFVSDSVNNPRDGWIIDDIFIYNQGVCSDLAENQLKIIDAYPNPFSHKTRIDLGPENYLHNGSYSLYDVGGNEILSKSSLVGHSFDIEKGNLPKGIYSLLVLENGAPISITRLSIY